MSRIQLKNITHSYADQSVLRALSLDIEANKLTCLLGGSGSGKTTILRLIAGLELAQEGQILIDNILVTDDGQLLVPPQKRKIAFVFQDLALWPHFTVYQNLAFGLKEQKQGNFDADIKDILNIFSIEDLSEKYPHQLSGGQQQLVAIARALVLKPNILLMDEPLANLDVKLKRRMLDYIKKIKTDFNLTLIYVTHDHKEAFGIADNIVILNEGKIEEIGSVEEIKKSENAFVKYFLEY